jgi:hypothetical protein
MFKLATVALLALAVAVSAQAPKVKVGFYTESL